MNRLLSITNLLGLTSSKGLFRTISALLLVAAGLPQMAPYREVLVELATYIGGLGLAKAVVVKATK